MRDALSVFPCTLMPINFSSFSSAALVMAAAFQWGLAGGLGSLLISWGWAPAVISFWRALVGFGCMAVWLATMRFQGRR